jgi:thiol-disulfide isomerase/thioredoxin
MRNPSSSWSLVVAASLMLAACMAHGELMVGDRAPKLQTGQWIQGEPVQAFESNHVYVVEFWATWCGPCVGSIPHLNALWEKFQDKGVIVIGQDVWDSDGAVAPFVKKTGTNMTYRVSLDDKSQDADGWMADHWWKRKVNHHGIPTAFIINKNGLIAWIGHPMQLNEQVLNDIVSGHQDLAKATVDYKKEWQINQKFLEAQQELNAALDGKRWNDADTALDQMLRVLPGIKDDYAGVRLKILLGQKKFEEASQVAESASKRYSKDADWENELAWTIASSDVPDAHSLAIAETMAERSVQLSQGTNSYSLGTLARVQFMLGKKTEAIITEGQAVKMEQNEQERSIFKKALASYQEGKLPNVNE